MEGGFIMSKLKKLAALAIGGAMLFSLATAFSAGTYNVQLPEGALLSELRVNSEVQSHVDNPANVDYGFYSWMYQFDMRIFADGDAPTQYLLYGDRAFAFNNMGRGGDGYRNFVIRSMPDFLVGAHFIQIANDGRNPAHATVSDYGAPYIAFTAAQPLYAYLGVDMRISPYAYLVFDHIPASDWQFMGVDYFIENNETDQLSGNRNPNFFDPDHIYDHYGPVRFYLHRMFVDAGQTVEIPTPGMGNPMITLAFIAADDAGSGAENGAAGGNDSVSDSDTTDGEDDNNIIIFVLIGIGVVLLVVIIFFVVKKK